MADHYILSLIGAMDNLWFHRTVLFSSSQPHKQIDQQNSPSPSSESESESESESSLLTPQENIIIGEEIERPARLKLISSKSRSLSSSPTVQYPDEKRKLKQTNSMLELQKSMSSRRLWELELEEIKGFMDLGFIFKREHLNPRIMRVVPGLQRVGFYKRNPEEEEEEQGLDFEDISKEEEENERGIIGPYLSEAWVIKRPDSPLLKLRMARVSASAADMKKHLRFWAKTVASTVQQEC